MAEVTFRKILDMLRYKHLLVLASYLLAAIAVSWPVSLQSFVVTLAGALLIFFSVYGYNYATDRKEDMGSNKATPLSYISEKQVLAITAILGLAALLISSTLGALSLATALAIILLGIAYSHENLRLKKYFALKTVSITIGWFLLFLYFTLSLQTTKILESIVIGSFLALVSAGGTLLRDLLDVSGDRMASVKTLPVVIGENNTLLVITATVFANYLILAASLALSILPATYLALLAVIPARIGMIHSLAKKSYGTASHYSLASYFLVALIALAVEVVK